MAGLLKLLFFLFLDTTDAVAHTSIYGYENNVVTAKDHGADCYFGAGTSAGGGPEVGFAEQTFKAASAAVEKACRQGREASGVYTIGGNPV